MSKTAGEYINVADMGMETNLIKQSSTSLALLIDRAPQNSITIQLHATLVLASICAPLSSSSLTIITLPLLEAICRGVMPFWWSRGNILVAVSLISHQDNNLIEAVICMWSMFIKVLKKKSSLTSGFHSAYKAWDELTLGVKFTLAPLFSSSWATLIFS